MKDCCHERFHVFNSVELCHLEPVLYASKFVTDKAFLPIILIHRKVHIALELQLKYTVAYMRHLGTVETQHSVTPLV